MKKNEKKERQEKNNRLLKIIIMILILIIILLLLCRCTRENEELKPTGNVDIFDIIFGNNTGSDCNCTCDKPDENGKCTTCNNTQTGGNSFGSSNPDDDGYFEGLYVYDDDKVFSQSTTLNIFTQTSYYVAKDRIAPGSQNTYQFVIRNNNNFGIKYSIDMAETNLQNINMKYRLRLNGRYIVGNENDYVSFDELNQYDVILNNQSSNEYELDWKWIESSNDTEIGENIGSKYRLDLVIRATKN